MSKKRNKRYQRLALRGTPQKTSKYGFIPPIIEASDYWLGSGKLGTQEINPKAEWLGHLPAFELQNRGKETNCCVSFGTLSALEILHRFQYDSEPNYSDRFLCALSGTDPNSGNNPKKVSDTLRHGGCVKETEYPFVLEEFFQKIPLNIEAKGLEWLKDYEVGYEYVAKDKIREALKRSPVGCAVYAWSQNDKGEYIKLGNPNHWVVLIGFDKEDRPMIYDSYETSVKILEKGYELEFAQIYTLKKKPIPAEEIKEYKKGGSNWLTQIWNRLVEVWFYIF